MALLIFNWLQCNGRSGSQRTLFSIWLRRDSPVMSVQMDEPMSDWFRSVPVAMDTIAFAAKVSCGLLLSLSMPSKPFPPSLPSRFCSEVSTGNASWTDSILPEPVSTVQDLHRKDEARNGSTQKVIQHLELLISCPSSHTALLFFCIARTNDSLSAENEQLKRTMSMSSDSGYHSMDYQEPAEYSNSNNKRPMVSASHQYFVFLSMISMP